LSRCVLSSGDAAGLLMFSDEVVRELPAEKGVDRYSFLIGELATVSYYGGQANIEGMMEYLYRRYTEGSLIFIISDFVQPISNQKMLLLLAKKFDLVMILLRDPRDTSLPSGMGEVLM